MKIQKKRVFFLIAKNTKNAQKSKKNGQRRRDSAVCRTELLASNFFFVFGPLGPHGALKMNFLPKFYYFLPIYYYFL